MRVQLPPDAKPGMLLRASSGHHCRLNKAQEIPLWEALFRADSFEYGSDVRLQLGSSSMLHAKDEADSRPWCKWQRRRGLLSMVPRRLVQDTLSHPLIAELSIPLDMQVARASPSRCQRTAQGMRSSRWVCHGRP